MTDAMVEAVVRDLIHAGYNPATAPEIARIAIAAMQAHMVQAGWRQTPPDDNRAVACLKPLTEREKAKGWTETPLYAFGEPK